MTQESTGQKAEPIVSQLARLARAEVAPDEFFRGFFGLVQQAMRAEAGNIWMYNAQSRQLVPKVRALPDDGPLKDISDDVFSNVAYRTVEQKMPVLYFPEEGTAADQPLRLVSLISVPVEIDARTWVVVLVARPAAARPYAREDVHTLQTPLRVP